MSNRFHSKYHRFNHHTCNNVANPDAGHDPIASPDSPFLGDFHLKGALSAYNSDKEYSGYFRNNCVGIIAQGNEAAIRAFGDSCVVGDLYVTGNVNVASISVLGAVDEPDPVFYNFSNEFTTNAGLSTTQVSLKIDGQSIYLNPNNQLTVNYAPIYEQFTNLVGNLTASNTDSPSSINIIVGSGNLSTQKTYLFGSGLVSNLLETGLNSETYSVSAAVDQNTITYNEAGQLKVAKTYTYGLGLSADENVKIITAYIDGQTLTFNNAGQIIGNYKFDGYNSGLSTNSSVNSVSANVDGTSTFIQNGKIVSGYKFSSTSSGLVCTPGSGDLPSLSINTNNTTLKINPVTGALDTQNVLITNLPSSETQTVGGIVSFTNTISASNGILFKDGSIISSSASVASYIDKLTELKNSNSTGSVVTSDDRIINWGTNNQLAFGNNRTKIWPPCVLPFEGNYLELNKASGVKIKKVVQSSYITMALLTDGTLWASGANTLGMLGIGKFTLDPKTNTPIHFPKVFNLCRVLGFPSGTIISDFSYAEIYNVAAARAEAAFSAISSNGTAFLWGFNFRNMFGATNTGVLLPYVNTTPFTPYSPVLNLSTGGYFTSNVKKIHLTADYFNRTKFDNNTDGTANNAYQPCYRGSSLILTYEPTLSAGRVYAAGNDQFYQLGVGSTYGGNVTEAVDRREVRSFQVCRDGDYLSGNGPLYDVADILNTNPLQNTVIFLKTLGNQIRVAGLNGSSNTFGTTNAYNSGSPGGAINANTTYSYFVTHPTLINVSDVKILGGGGFGGANNTISIYAITSDGLYVWGNNNNGQLGLPYTLPTQAVPAPQTNILTPTKLNDFISATFGSPSKVIVPEFNLSSNKPLVAVITSNKQLFLAGFRNPVQYSDFIDLGVVGFKRAPISNVSDVQISTDYNGNVAGLLIKDSINRIFIYSLISNSSFAGFTSDFIYPPAEITKFLV